MHQCRQCCGPPPQRRPCRLHRGQAGHVANCSPPSWRYRRPGLRREGCPHRRPVSPRSPREPCRRTARRPSACWRWSGHRATARARRPGPAPDAFGWRARRALASAPSIAGGRIARTAIDECLSWECSDDSAVMDNPEEAVVGDPAYRRRVEIPLLADMRIASIRPGSATTSIRSCDSESMIS